MKIEKATSEISFTVKFWSRKLTLAFGNKKNLKLKQFENTLEVWFYATRIARLEIEESKVYLANGGWETKTTKNHLNQILQTLYLPYAVTQKKFQWYLGERKFNSQIEIEANLK